MESCSQFSPSSHLLLKLERTRSLVINVDRFASNFSIWENWSNFIFEPALSKEMVRVKPEGCDIKEESTINFCRFHVPILRCFVPREPYYRKQWSMAKWRHASSAGIARNSICSLRWRMRYCQGNVNRFRGVLHFDRYLKRAGDSFSRPSCSLRSNTPADRPRIMNKNSCKLEHARLVRRSSDISRRQTRHI